MSEPRNLTASEGTTAAPENLIGRHRGGAALAGALAGVALLGASVTGSASITGDLQTGAADLAGTLAGSATVAADLTDFPATPGELLEASITGAALITGDLLAGADDLAGTLAGSASLAGALQAFPGLAGSIAGSATVNGTLADIHLMQGVLAGQSWISGTFASDFTPRIPLTMDLTPFFDNSELAQDALLNANIPFLAIFLDFYNPIVGGSVGLFGTEPTMIAQHEQIPDVREGDVVSIDTWQWTVREVMPDNTGIVRLKVEVV